MMLRCNSRVLPGNKGKYPGRVRMKKHILFDEDVRWIVHLIRWADIAQHNVARLDLEDCLAMRFVIQNSYPRVGTGFCRVSCSSEFHDNVQT